MNTTIAVAEYERHFLVSLCRQTLTLCLGSRSLRAWPVSTARNGAGELRGSECTPRGWHQIRACIGAGMAPNTVFRGRRPTGEIYDAELDTAFPGRDWILTRILWLGGLEPGVNRYGDVDTTWRYIYIHGSPDYGVAGTPASHGCIRMKTSDMLQVFEEARSGMRVCIQP